MKVYGFFMKALSISECYCNSKKQSICSCYCRADCMDTLMELQRLDQQSFQPNICLGQNQCLRVSALEKRGMVGCHYYYIYFFIIEIVYIDIALFTPPPPHFSAYLTLFCSKFTIKCLGSGQKPKYRSSREISNTRLYFLPYTARQSVELVFN